MVGLKKGIIALISMLFIFTASLIIVYADCFNVDGDPVPGVQPCPTGNWICCENNTDSVCPAVYDGANLCNDYEDKDCCLNASPTNVWVNPPVGEAVSGPHDQCCGDDFMEEFYVSAGVGPSGCCDLWTDCIDGNGICQSETFETTCDDSQDNDCDGMTDETDPNSCTIDLKINKINDWNTAGDPYTIARKTGFWLIARPTRGTNFGPAGRTAYFCDFQGCSPTGTCASEWSFAAFNLNETGLPTQLSHFMPNGFNDPGGPYGYYICLANNSTSANLFVMDNKTCTSSLFGGYCNILTEAYPSNYLCNYNNATKNWDPWNCDNYDCTTGTEKKCNVTTGNIYNYSDDYRCDNQSNIAGCYNYTKKKCGLSEEICADSCFDADGMLPYEWRHGTKQNVTDYNKCGAGDTSCPFTKYEDVCLPTNPDILIEYTCSGNNYGFELVNCSKNYSTYSCNVSGANAIRVYNKWGCSNGICAPGIPWLGATEVCNKSKECQLSTIPECNTKRCHNNGSAWLWEETMPSTEKYCNDGNDNDCDDGGWYDEQDENCALALSIAGTVGVDEADPYTSEPGKNFYLVARAADGNLTSNSLTPAQARFCDYQGCTATGSCTSGWFFGDTSCGAFFLTLGLSYIDPKCGGGTKDPRFFKMEVPINEPAPGLYSYNFCLGENCDVATLNVTAPTHCSNITSHATGDSKYPADYIHFWNSTTWASANCTDICIDPDNGVDANFTQTNVTDREQCNSFGGNVSCPLTNYEDVCTSATILKEYYCGATDMLSMDVDCNASCITRRGSDYSGECSAGKCVCISHFSISGYVYNITSSKPIYNAKVQVLSKTKYEAFTDVSGYYLTTDITSDEYYDIAASKPGFEPKVNYSVFMDKSKSIDFYLSPATTNCLEDCTKGDGICHANCYWWNGCYFYDTNSSSKCDGKTPGMRASYNATHEIGCCTGSPSEKQTPIISVKVEPKAENAVRISRIVMWEGRPIKMIIDVFG